MTEPVKKTKSNLPGAGPGRPKGVPNKVSRIAKEAIADVFEELGGVPAMVIWASENQTAFYNMYSKLLPVQLSGEGGGPIGLVINVAFD